MKFRIKSKADKSKWDIDDLTKEISELNNKSSQIKLDTITQNNELQALINSSGNSSLVKLSFCLFSM